MEKISVLLISLLFAFTLAAVTLLSMVFTQEIGIMYFYTLLFVLVGWFNSELKDELKDVVLLNLLAIILLITITRTASFMFGGVVEPLEIFSSFIAYTVIANFTSLVALYVRGEL